MRIVQKSINNLSAVVISYFSIIKGMEGPTIKGKWGFSWTVCERVRARNSFFDYSLLSEGCDRNICIILVIIYSLIFEKWEDNAKNTVALHSLNVIQENYKNNYRFCKYNHRYSITLTEAIFFGENNVHCLLLVLHKQHIMLPFVAIQCRSVQKGIGLQSVYNQSAAMIKWRLKQSIPCCAFILHWHKKSAKKTRILKTACDRCVQEVNVCRREKK